MKMNLTVLCAVIDKGSAYCVGQVQPEWSHRRNNQTKGLINYAPSTALAYTSYRLCSISKPRQHGVVCRVRRAAHEHRPLFTRRATVLIACLFDHG